MANNQVVTSYDDAGYPAAPSRTVFLTGTAAVKTAPGRLHKIVVTTTTSAAVTVYDNATAASGTVLFAVPSSAPVGSAYAVDLPALNGIYASFAGTGTLAFGYA
jgi:hypothetical protein